MKITKINVGYSCKVMARQYEPIESTIGVEVMVEERDDADEVVQKLQNYCEKKVMEALPNMAKDLF